MYPNGATAPASRSVIPPEEQEQLSLFFDRPFNDKMRNKIYNHPSQPLFASVEIGRRYVQVSGP